MKAKSVLVIGLGRFGRHLANKMRELGNDVMIVDKNEKLVDELAPKFTDSHIGDCTNEAVIRRTRELGMVSIPGALTPTEVMTAHKAGADFVKLFPAGCFGPGYVKAVKAPLSHIKLLVVGSIDENNLASFLSAGAAGAGVGGNLVNKAWVEAGQYDKITEVARLLVAAAN